LFQLVTVDTEELFVGRIVCEQTIPTFLICCSVWRYTHTNTHTPT